MEPHIGICVLQSIVGRIVMPFSQPLLAAFFLVELAIVCAFLCVDIDFWSVARLKKKNKNNNRVNWELDFTERVPTKNV